MPNDEKGSLFEKQVLETLNGMGIVSYGKHEQIPLLKLHPGSKPGGNLEIDIVCQIGNICILVETTIKSDNNSKKIKRFIRHCKLVVDSPLSKRDLFSLFTGIKEEELLNFTGISDWRYLYIGKSSELSTENITSDMYPETNRLHIYDEENWEYIRILERTIKETAKYELLASLNINPSDLADTYLGGIILTKRCLPIANRTLFSGQNQVHADLFVVTFTPNELLRIARVLRYQGQPFGISSGSRTNNQSGGYQRILVPEKLKKIREFINNDNKVAFPTNLTIVLSNECEQKDDEVHIPSKYASIDVIDGQHRLFSYASMSEEVRNEAILITTAIKFKENENSEINRYAARTFITINSEQTKVKQDQIYLISYDVLEKKTPESNAAKVIQLCDSKDNGVLSRLFAVRTFVSKNDFGETPIAITQIIKTLSRITKKERIQEIQKILGKQDSNNRHSDPLIQLCTQLLEEYFSLIKKVFNNDWRNPISLLMSAKYIGGFISLLDAFVTEQLTTKQMYQELKMIKHNILQKYNEGRINGQDHVFSGTAFYSYRDEQDVDVSKPLLSKKEGSIEKIYKFLNESRNNSLQP